MSADLIFKLVIAGDGAVGKTTLLHRYVEGVFKYDMQMTIGVNILRKTLVMEDSKRILLQLWDFGGQEQFRFMLHNYVLGSSGAIIMFDLTRSKTTERIEEWVDIVKGPNPNVPLILLGGKADLEDKIEVSDEYIDKLIDVHNFIGYLKTSSKTGENVDATFKKLINKIIELKFGGI